MTAYLDPRTGETFRLDQPRAYAPGYAPLALTPMPGITRRQIDRQTQSLWRYRAALPLQPAEPITLGEGRTPLLSRALIVRDGERTREARVLMKCDWVMPTGSFKDRGASV